jgi:hypothetical protein
VSAYTAAEVASMFGTSKWFVQEQVRRGRVGCLRVGAGRNARMRFEPEHVEQLRRLMTPVKSEPKRRRRRRVA